MICLLCSTQSEAFLNSNALCPNCGSSDRERLIFYYGSTVTTLFTRRIKLLHFSPEDRSFEIFSKILTYIDYYPTSFSPSGRFTKVDITDTKINDNFFDTIICSHILEHVKDDKKAITELYRILAIHGVAIIAIPISDKKITEEFQKADNDGHVRIYGSDFKQKLEDLGFEVEIYRPTEKQTKDFMISIHNDPLYIAKKVRYIHV